MTTQIGRGESAAECAGNTLYSELVVRTALTLWIIRAKLLALGILDPWDSHDIKRTILPRLPVFIYTAKYLLQNVAEIPPQSQAANNNGSITDDKG